MKNRRSFIKGGLFGGLASLLAGKAATAKTTQQSEKRPTHQYDVVVLGCGFAGMCAALEAKEKGANVVLLEKMGYPAGNTIYAGGWISAVGSRFQKNHPEDTIEAFYDDMMRISGNRSIPRLLRTYAEQAGKDVDWLADRGVPFELVENLPPPELSRSLAIPGITRGGAILTRHMLAALRNAEVPILFNTKAVSLVLDDCLNVQGVSCITPKGREDFLAKGGVVIATGGHGSNMAMVSQYIGPWATRLVLRGSHWCTGENLLMGQQVMAKTIYLDQFYAGPITPTGSCNPSSIMHTGYGIQVNTDGKRFLTESLLQVPKAIAIAQKTKNNISYLLLDSTANDYKNILDKTYKRFQRLSMEPYRGETIAELAQKAGIPPANLEATVKEFNAAVRSKTTDKLDPPHGYENPHLIEKGPFYLIPVSGGICSTMGGLLINDKAQVLNLEEVPVKGLYAAGASAGGLWYAEDLGGNQLGGCMVFGRIAGREAAKMAKAAP